MDLLFSPTPEHVLNVTDLTRQIKSRLEGDFTRIWVRGEVSNLRRQNSGHVYFSLKDSGSLLPCVLFARDAARQGLYLKDGMSLLLFGSLSVYEPHGRYQLVAKIALQSGQGQLQLEYERLKRKLAGEGLFEKDRKQPLPILPMRIAVITSPSGAAIRDFLRILQRRSYSGQVIIFPARVQGKEAAGELTGMLQYAAASADIDLIVLTRGGGSIEDLWPFNDETLAREVAKCPLPVISAIGHEIDTVLTDYVADKRAETPSAAAELISSLTLEVRQRLLDSQKNLIELVQSTLLYKTQSLQEIQARMHAIAPQHQIQILGMRLDDLENQLSQSLQKRLIRGRMQLDRLSGKLAGHHPRNRINLSRLSTENLEQRMLRAVQVAAKARREHIENLEKRLESSSLKATLKRGYAVLKNNDGEIIDRAENGKRCDYITAYLQDGQLPLKTCS